MGKALSTGDLLKSAMPMNSFLTGVRDAASSVAIVQLIFREV
ncbi:hypothetical protein ACOWPH_22745 [Anabaena sp. PCC 7938]|nr:MULTISPECIES: hypothetical protein [Anabaena]